MCHINNAFNHAVPTPSGTSIPIVIDAEGNRFLSLERLAPVFGLSLRGDIIPMVEKRYWQMKSVNGQPCIPYSHASEFFSKIKDHKVPVSVRQFLGWCRGNVQRVIGTYKVPVQEPAEEVTKAPATGGFVHPEPVLVGVLPPTPTTAFPVATVAQINGYQVNAVNARDLHAFLGIGKDFSTWIKVQVERARLVENRDFVVLPQKGENSEGRPKLDYYVTFDAAKQIGMMCGTDKGFEIRDYFLECERKLTQAPPANPFLTMDRRSLLALALEQEDTIQLQATKLELKDSQLTAQTTQLVAKDETISVLTPGAEFASRVSVIGDALTISQFAKILGTGRNRFFEWCRSKGYMMAHSTEPLQRWVDQGLFLVKERLCEDLGGMDRLYVKTFITGKGQLRFQAEWDADHKADLDKAGAAFAAAK